MSKLQILQAVLFGLLVGAFCSGCGPRHSGVDAGSDGGEAGSFIEPKTGGNGNDPGTGGASTGGASGCPASCPETGGEPSTGGAAPAVGGAGGSDPGTGGDVGTGGEGTGGSDPATGGASGSTSSDGGEAGALAGAGGSEDGGASGEPATGGLAPAVGGAGGSDPGTGGAGTGGSDPATGGASGEPGVGGEAGVIEGSGGTNDGGSSGSPNVGGASGETGTGGAASATATGGQGGSNPGTGGNVGTGGTGGTGGEVQAQPFSCSGWTREENFVSGMDLTGDICGSSAGDVYVSVSKYSSDGNIAHWNGTDWSLELPEDGAYRELNALSCVGGDVLAGGAIVDGTFNRAVLLHRDNSGDWQNVWTSPTVAQGGVFSVWRANPTHAIVGVGYAPNVDIRDVKIYERIGTAMSEMTLPPHPPAIQINRIRGFSLVNVYAVGCLLDANNDCSDSVLWHYDGIEWNEITSLPSDVTVLHDVAGNADGELYVSGSVHNGSEHRGVILWTNDMVNWNRYDSPTQQVGGPLWTPRLGAVLAAANTPSPSELYQVLLSESEATETSIGTLAYGSGIYASGSEAFIAAYRGTGNAGVYRTTCQ